MVALSFAWSENGNMLLVVEKGRNVVFMLKRGESTTNSREDYDR